MQYHVFSEFNKTYLQLSSGYDMIPLIEKGVADRGSETGNAFWAAVHIGDSTISEDDIRDMK